MNLDELKVQVYRGAMKENYGDAVQVPELMDMFNSRPGITPVEEYDATSARSMSYLADKLEREVSIFADTVQTIVQETLRNGIEWKPRFAKKCLLCDYESKDNVETCPVCGSDKMRDPNKAELRLFSRLDGTSFIDKANDNGQTLIDVLNLIVHNVVVFDRVHLLSLNAYVTDKEGEIQQTYLQEILALDPRFVDYIYEHETGKPGNGTKLCLEHRDLGQDTDADYCRKCNKKLYNVTHRSLASRSPIAYIEGEVISRSLYHPYLVTGFPLCLKMTNLLLTYKYLEDRERAYYEKGRPPGLLDIPTNNVKSTFELWTKVQEKLKEDPYYIPLLTHDTTSGSRTGIQFIPLMQDPNADMLAVKEEIRQRVGSMYGVTIIYQNDTSGSGGLKNDLNLVRVTRNTMERIRRFLNNLLRELVTPIGIVDHDLVVASDDDEDKAAEIELSKREAEYAQMLVNMGIEAEFDDGNWKFNKAVIGGKQQPMMNPLLAAPNAPQPKIGDDPGSSDSLIREPDEPVPKPEEAVPDETKKEAMSDEEFIDSIVNKKWMVSRKKQLIQALSKMQKMSAFKDLSPQEAEEAYSKLVTVMSKDKWTVVEASKALQKMFPQLNEAQAEVIARTESMAVAGKARELDFIENDPPDALYKWQGPTDRRTTDCCLKASQGSVEGMPLEQLKTFIQDIAIEEGFKPREWVLHPNERHRAVRLL